MCLGHSSLVNVDFNFAPFLSQPVALVSCIFFSSYHSFIFNFLCIFIQVNAKQNFSKMIFWFLIASYSEICSLHLQDISLLCVGVFLLIDLSVFFPFS